MSTELYLPPVNSREYKKAADAAHMDYIRKHINRAQQRKRSLEVNCKPVDVFDLQGHYIASYPSYKAAEEDLGIYKFGVSRCMSGYARSANGYMFRKHQDHPVDIAPAPPRDCVTMQAYKPRLTHYHPCKLIYPDGTEKLFDCVRDAEATLGCTRSYAYRLLRMKKPVFNGITIKYINEK